MDSAIVGGFEIRVINLRYDRKLMWAPVLGSPEKPESPGVYNITFAMPAAAKFGFYIRDTTPGFVHFRVASAHQNVPDVYYHKQAWVSTKFMLYTPTPTERSIRYSLDLMRYKRTPYSMARDRDAPDGFMFETYVVEHAALGSTETKETLALRDTANNYRVPVCIQETDSGYFTAIGLPVHINITLHCRQPTMVIQLRNYTLQDEWRRHKIDKVMAKIDTYQEIINTLRASRDTQNDEDIKSLLESIELQKEKLCKLKQFKPKLH